jgi:hypothetical protein
LSHRISTSALVAGIPAHGNQSTIGCKHTKGATTMARPAHGFEKLAGVRVHYDRIAAPFGSGTRGKPTKFYAGQAFAAKLSEQAHNEGAN